MKAEQVFDGVDFKLMMSNSGDVALGVRSMDIYELQ